MSANLGLRTNVGTVLIVHRDYPGMNAAKRSELSGLGITTANQLAAMGVQAIDDLPIAGVGAVRARQWWLISHGLLAIN